MIPVAGPWNVLEYREEYAYLLNVKQIPAPKNTLPMIDAVKLDKEPSSNKITFNAMKSSNGFCYYLD
jgi:hypothetical protein